ncbi:Gfo/Idh/MocA family oxidoreductase [Microlunatus aurantiacus]|uniref:Gfo/Idh/MocA family oxidoreductase n=1 Tax=Microlunatus aurantiacus TaxID=446786 RepID=A0ABP7CSM9_9ACTN
MPDPTPSPLRVAVVGAWHVHAGDYARRTLEHPHAELVAVWDDDPERGAALAGDTGAPFTQDLAGLLARSDVDAVTITTETVAHREVIGQAIAAGKHVFTEKLLAPTVAEADEILTAARAAGRQVVVSLPRLYHGYATAVTEVVDGGTLGRLTYARVRLSHDGATAGWLPERFFDPATAIGGALTDLGCHPVYLVQRILGSTPQTVSATYRSLTGRDVDDHAVVTVGYADGAIGVIEAGFVSANPFTIEVFGTEGSLTYSDATGELLLSDAKGRSWHAAPVPADAPDAYDRWLTAIATETEDTDNLERAVELTRLVVAANEAARTGTAVDYA